MATNDPMAEAISGMASTGNPRQPMDRDAVATVVNGSADYTSGAQMHPRYSQPANDPAFFPTARPAPQQLEPGGARFRLEVPISIPALPEAGPTTANGRLIGSAGTGGSFAGGAAG